MSTSKNTLVKTAFNDGYKMSNNKKKYEKENADKSYLIWNSFMMIAQSLLLKEMRKMLSTKT